MTEPTTALSADALAAIRARADTPRATLLMTPAEIRDEVRVLRADRAALLAEVERLTTENERLRVCLALSGEPVTAVTTYTTTSVGGPVPRTTREDTQ